MPPQDIDKSSTEINRHKVQIETAQKMIKKLTKGIAESKKEKEQFVEERVKMERIFDEILEKAHNVQEHYTNTQKV